MSDDPRTIVSITQVHTWPHRYAQTVRIEDTRGDLNAEDMHQLLYQAMVAIGYCKETVDEIAKDDTP